MIFQQFNLVRNLSVLTNVLTGRLGYVSFGNGLLLRRNRAVTAEARQCLARVGLEHLAGQTVRNLSGGQQQRVAIARRSCSVRASFWPTNRWPASIPPRQTACCGTSAISIARTYHRDMLAALSESGAQVRLAGHRPQGWRHRVRRPARRHRRRAVPASTARTPRRWRYDENLLENLEALAADLLLYGYLLGSAAWLLARWQVVGLPVSLVVLSAVMLAALTWLAGDSPGRHFVLGGAQGAWHRRSVGLVRGAGAGRYPAHRVGGGGREPRQVLHQGR
jgi:hypothetical protein